MLPCHQRRDERRVFRFHGSWSVPKPSSLGSETVKNGRFGSTKHKRLKKKSPEKSYFLGVRVVLGDVTGRPQCVCREWQWLPFVSHNGSIEKGLTRQSHTLNGCETKLTTITHTTPHRGLIQIKYILSRSIIAPHAFSFIFIIMITFFFILSKMFCLMHMLTQKTKHIFLILQKIYNKYYLTK